MKIIIPYQYADLNKSAHNATKQDLSITDIDEIDNLILPAVTEVRLVKSGNITQREVFINADTGEYYLRDNRRASSPEGFFLQHMMMKNARLVQAVMSNLRDEAMQEVITGVKQFVITSRGVMQKIERPRLVAEGSPSMGHFRAKLECRRLGTTAYTHNYPSNVLDLGAYIDEVKRRGHRVFPAGFRLDVHQQDLLREPEPEAGVSP